MENLVLLSIGDQGWGDELLAGLMITLMLALLALPVGLFIGTSVAALSISSSRIGRLFALFYTTLIRGLPELLTLFIIYHGVGLLLNQVVKWFSPNVKYVEFSPFLAGVIALGLVFSSYAAEVIRGAWQAMDKGQKEAGIALAMNRWLIFWFVERPQIIRLALPGLGNLWINLLKDTALVSVIALDDLMRAANIAVGATKKPFFFYLSVCLLYWLICVLCERVLFKMETRLNRGIHTGR
ncbi:ABC transporter permease subunit [Maribrevibacterium harenarium]|uniref:ABC transporter permease subunit n=1 Tax=Maribrevibacterium harenarium TaxID=2589817 RepID=A0A501WA21_9GAMM|nr:ABC transporter permease subunit [Maribrevibacterium harenarium]TPE46469.1 ABC transporter permease subunit [Maribrevibacterium harenarium]